MIGGPQSGPLGPGAPEGGNDEDWLGTYADAITLLMAFFVMLLSMSVIDLRKYETMSEGIKAGLNHQAVVEQDPTEGDQPVEQVLAAPTESDVEAHTVSEVLATSLETLEKSKIVDVTTSAESVILAFQGETLYPPAGADLRPEAIDLLNEVAGVLKGVVLDDYVIGVEGHTDDAPIRSPRFPSNWELSSLRATNVVRHLISRGVDPQTLEAIAFAHTRPLVPNRAEDGTPIAANRSKNRRIVIRVERRLAPSDTSGAAEERNVDDFVREQSGSPKSNPQP